MASSPDEFLLKVEDFSLLQPKLLWCYEGDVDGGSRRKVSSERHLYAWWLLRGNVTLRRGTQSWSARNGQWLFGGPQPRLQDFSSDARILSINFKLEWPSGDSLIDQPLVLRAADYPALGDSSRALLRFVRSHFPGTRTRLWQHSTGLIPFFKLHGLFSAWLVAYLGAALDSGVIPSRMSGMDPRVLEALRELNRHAWTDPLREKDLAGKVGLSPGHLDRLFVRQMQMTPGAYLQKRRFESARASLLDSSAPVKKIAYDLGFSSPGHFCYWFRKISGRTPTAFRKAKR